MARRPGKEVLMFETFSHLALQQYWWLIMSIVASVLVFLLFVQGGQTLIGVIGKTEEGKTMVINSLGRKWEFTYTTLIVFAAGMFASFPKFYSTSFGGAYYAWMLFLVSFVVQAVSYEFRKKPGNLLGQKTYEAFLYFNGFVGLIVLGGAVATFFTGSKFFVNDYNLSAWKDPLHGIEILFNFDNVALGLAILFLARVMGAMYLFNNIDEEEIRLRARKQILINALPFLVFFLFFVGRILVKDGFAYDPVTKEVFMEPYKYLNNFLQMPITLVLFLAGVVLVLLGLYVALWKKSHKAIWFSGTGTVLTVLSLFLILGYNNTAFYPSTFDLQSSLTIENSSSSHYTLTAMSYISLFVPVVIAYIFFAWRAIDKKKIKAEDLKNEHHLY